MDRSMNVMQTWKVTAPRVDWKLKYPLNVGVDEMTKYKKIINLGLLLIISGFVLDIIQNIPIIDINIILPPTHTMIVIIGTIIFIIGIVYDFKQTKTDMESWYTDMSYLYMEYLLEY